MRIGHSQPATILELLLLERHSWLYHSTITVLALIARMNVRIRLIISIRMNNTVDATIADIYVMCNIVSFDIKINVDRWFINVIAIGVWVPVVRSITACEVNGLRKQFWR